MAFRRSPLRSRRVPPKTFPREILIANRGTIAREHNARICRTIQREVRYTNERRIICICRKCDYNRYIQRAAVRRITLPGNRNSGRGNINCTAQTRRCFPNYTHKLNAQGKFVTLSIRNEVFVSRAPRLSNLGASNFHPIFYAKYHVRDYLAF